MRHLKKCKEIDGQGAGIVLSEVAAAAAASRTKGIKRSASVPLAVKGRDGEVRFSYVVFRTLFSYVF